MIGNGQVGRQKADRHDAFAEFTNPICPVCKMPLDAQVSIRDRKVYLWKRCSKHGWFETLLFSDAGW